MRRFRTRAGLAALAFVSLGWVARAVDAPTRPPPVSAHNCYLADRRDNPRLVEALALGIDNVEIDLGWDDAAKRLIVGHDAAPRAGVAYPEFESMLVPALEAHWKAHPPGPGVAPTVLTVDWKTDRPKAVARFKAFLDAHADWFSSAPKADPSPLTVRRLTVCLTGGDAAKDAYDALVPAGGSYRAFRDTVVGVGARYEPDVAAYAPRRATAYHRFLTWHWGVVEQGGPLAAAVWTPTDAARLAALVDLAHCQGYRVRVYCLDGHTGPLLGGYRFRTDADAKLRWLAAAKAGVDWVASDEYAEIVVALRTAGPALLTPPRPRTISSGEKAIKRAEEYVRTQGYTDFTPTDLEGLNYDIAELMTYEEPQKAVASRRNRLRPRAVGYLPGGHGDEAGWTVAFALTKPLADPTTGVAVTMDHDGANMKVEHMGFDLKALPLHRTADLDVGETARLALSDGTTATVKLLGLDVTTDPVNDAVRSARVRLEVDGQAVTLGTGNYLLPVTVGRVQVDCPVVSAYNRNTTVNHWSLEKAARVRVWPSGSPWIAPGTLGYPVRQAWFASMTQMANEPVYVDAGEVPAAKKIYYHSGLDNGGADGMVDVIAATDGRVVSSGRDQLPGAKDSPVEPRYDVVYLLDHRGWYYRYSHMQSIDPAVKPGATVTKGQKIGVLGKEGGSGGWSHLHFEIKARQPSGKWGTEEGHAFLWQAVLDEQKPDVVAVARPHRVARVGDTVTLDATKSWTRVGPPARFDWTFSDGSAASAPVVERVYREPGCYSEVLKVTDNQGRSSYDFAVVQVFDPAPPDRLPPTIHAAFFPTSGVKPGDPVTFKVRTFRVGRDGGNETWDFGDGSPLISVQSDGNAREHDPDGYAVFAHAFAKPGDYLVRVERQDRHGLKATARLWVRVGGR
jgi:murein DD-endopeptidase MepM/ murein hydrolase activator NlpD